MRGKLNLISAVVSKMERTESSSRSPLENIFFQMLADSRHINPEKVGHPFPGEPDIFIMKKNLDLDLAVRCCVEQEFRQFVPNGYLVCHLIRLSRPL